LTSSGNESLQEHFFEDVSYIPTMQPTSGQSKQQWPFSDMCVVATRVSEAYTPADRTQIIYRRISLCEIYSNSSTNAEIANELNTTPVSDKIQDYKRK
jgi:hypothetical protein